MNAIVAEDISKNFYNHIVLSKLNMNVNEGDIYGLIGLNGIGKTTLIKLLLSIAKPDDGNIEIFGQRITRKNKANNSANKIRKKICYLPEKFTPSSELTGREVIEMLAKFHRDKISQNELKRWCDKFHFDFQDLRRKIRDYSKGMVQKVGLISTFATKSKLYILDEPMSGLDFKSRNVLKQEIKEINKQQGATIFFTSHIMSDIDELSNRVGVLHNYKLVFEDSLIKLKKHSNNLEDAVLKLTG